MGNNEDENSTAIHITEEANRVYSELVHWEEGDFLSVKFDRQWLPGKILEVLCMKYADDFNRNNKFRWVEKDLSRCFNKRDILLNITAPILK